MTDIRNLDVLSTYHSLNPMYPHPDWAYLFRLIKLFFSLSSSSCGGRASSADCLKPTACRSHIVRNRAPRAYDSE